MNCKNKSFMTKRKAFTLIELLIVIAIIGILFIVLVSKVDFATDKAKATGVQTDFRSFQMAFDTVAKENAGFNTFGWDTGDANQNGKRDSYDEGDNGAGGGIAKNGIQDGTEVFTGHKIYAETFTKVYSLKKNGTGSYDRDALNRLETAINANLDPKLHITIKDDGEIVMANGAQDPWNKEYHGWYITNAEVDNKDRGAIIMYSDGANNEFGSEHTIANGVVTISIPGNNKYGKDDYAICSVYTYLNGYGEVKNVTSGFTPNQTMGSLTDNNTNNNPDVDPDDGNVELVTEGAGLFNNGELTMSWEDLIEQGVIHVDNGVVWTMETWDGSSDNPVADILVGDLVLPYGITALGDAYQDCAFEMYLGRLAFTGCTNLTGLIMPDTVTHMSDAALYDLDNMTTFRISSSLQHVGYFAMPWFDDELYYVEGDAWYLGNENNPYVYLYSVNEDATSFTINAQTKIIGDSAFWNSKIENLTIPNNITCICTDAFYDTKLKEIVIPNSITEIHEYSFRNNQYLETVVLPNGITRIDISSFEDCENLKYINIPNTVEFIGDDAFYGCDNLVLTEYDNAGYLGNDSNPYVVLYKALNTSIVSCEISPQTKFIAHHAFKDCNQLVSINIPNGVIGIGYRAFLNCTKLANVTLPNTLTELSQMAFQSCTSLKNIVLPTSLKTLRTGVFRSSGLTSLTIPNSITHITGLICYSNTALTHIAFDGTIAEWEAIWKDEVWKGDISVIYCTDGLVSVN